MSLTVENPENAKWGVSAVRKHKTRHRVWKDGSRRLPVVYDLMGITVFPDFSGLCGPLGGMLLSHL